MAVDGTPWGLESRADMLHAAIPRVAAVALVLVSALSSLMRDAIASADIVLKAQQLTARSWFFQGDTGMASAQNSSSEPCFDHIP